MTVHVQIIQPIRQFENQRKRETLHIRPCLMNVVKIVGNKYLDIRVFQIYSLYNFAVMAT